MRRRPSLPPDAHVTARHAIAIFSAKSDPHYQAFTIFHLHSRVKEVFFGFRSSRINTCMAGGGEAAQSSGASSRMLGRPPVRVSPRERLPLPDRPLEPMAHAEKAAVESALTFMMTSGLEGDPKSSATVASVGTPSGERGSAHITRTHQSEPSSRYVSAAKQCAIVFMCSVCNAMRRELLCSQEQQALGSQGSYPWRGY
jgi:hypothetical protein